MTPHQQKTVEASEEQASERGNREKEKGISIWKGDLLSNSSNNRTCHEQKTVELRGKTRERAIERPENWEKEKQEKRRRETDER